jgi:hypothetical protein
MPAKAPSEKRRHPRMPVILKVKRAATVHQPEQVDYATDLSEGGLFIRTDNRPRVGTYMKLEFTPLPGSLSVTTECRVVRVSSEGVAIEFTSLDSDSRQLLNLAIAS